MGMEISSSDAAYRTVDVATASKPEFTTVEAATPVEFVNTANNTADSVNSEEKKGNAPSESTVRQAISDINKKINPNTIAEYGYHEDTNRVTIKIVDKDSDKTIKEFPAEETLDMIAKVWELAGMFLDEKG